MAKNFSRFIRLGILGNQAESIRFSYKVDFVHLNSYERQKLQVDQTDLRKAINLGFRRHFEKRILSKWGLKGIFDQKRAKKGPKTFRAFYVILLLLYMLFL